MKEELKNIFNLSKLFIKENENNLKLINKEKINRKSILFFIYIILFFGIFYISSEIIKYIRTLGNPEIFLSGFLLFLELLIITRTTMISINIFYFSKDIENILHFPLKPREIIISKFITILFMNYEIELIFGIIPLLIYGIDNNMQLMYYFNIILGLIIFPIFPVLIVSIIMILLMKTIKLFRNKDLMQIVITLSLAVIMAIGVNQALNYVFNDLENINENKEIIINNINGKLIKVNNYFLTINPIKQILQENNFLKIVFYYLKLFFINIIGLIIFIFLGNKLYLKQLLKASFYFKNKKIKINLNKKIKRTRVGKSYIKKEFKILIKNPLYFIQNIYPVILITVIISLILIIMVPVYRNLLNTDEYRDALSELKFDIEAVCIILGAIQVAGLFNYTSITAISREGKNAYLMKLLPVDLYKQIIYKNIPQVLINSIFSAIILFVIKYQIPELENKYIFILFIISFLLNLINSIILIIIDLLMPKIEWDSEYEILKNNKNKLLQYVLIIFNIIFLIFIKNLFKNYNLNNSLIIFIIILIFIYTIINILINKYKNKLFKKIS